MLLNAYCMTYEDLANGCTEITAFSLPPYLTAAVTPLSLLPPPSVASPPPNNSWLIAATVDTTIPPPSHQNSGVAPANEVLPNPAQPAMQWITGLAACL